MASNVVLDQEHLQSVVDYFLTQDAFAFDIESVGVDRGVPAHNTVTWIALATQGMTAVIPMGHPNGDTVLRKATKKKNKEGKFDFFPAIYDGPPAQLAPSEVFSALKPLFWGDATKVAHNATFDLVSVAKYFGEIPPGPYGDTIVLQHLLNENLPQKGLKVLVEKYWKVVYDNENVGRQVEIHPFSKVAHYAFMDAKYTWLLWTKLLGPIFEEDSEGKSLAEVWNLESNLIGPLAHMRLHGAYIDRDELVRLEVDLSARQVETLADIYRVAGRKFNMNSSPQKANILFSPKSKGGQGLKPKVLTAGGVKKQEAGQELTLADYSTKAEILGDRYSGNPLVEEMLKYQTINKLLTTYVRGYLGVEGSKGHPCRIYDGRVYTDLVQYGTVTGRFSSREPNLQNIPRPDTELGKQIRGLFYAPEGYQMVVADYGQIEMILLAHYAGPGPLYHGIHDGIDPHSATAAGLAGIDPHTFTARLLEGDVEAKNLRQAAKAINFAVVFGAGPTKVASMAGLREYEAMQFLDIHRQQFPEIYRFKKKVMRVARERRPPHIRTLMGRKRRLPTLFAQDPKTKGYAERQAVNSLIQGSAADIIKLAMIRLHNTLEPDMHLILSVHDELVTVTPASKAHTCEAYVREAMLGEAVSGMLTVPLSADVKVVNRWSEAK